MDIVDSWTYVTYDLVRITELGVQSLTASDTPRINKISSHLYGITPTLINVTTEKFLKIHYSNITTGLDLAEQLFTARGGQGVATGTIVLTETQSDPTKYQSNHGDSYSSYFLMNINQYYSSLFYRVRPIWSAN
jgi:hypothetical protein